MSATQHRTTSEDWLAGGGEMGKVVRAKDWSHNPLGPLESWPQSLRTTVSLALSSNFPIAIAWGPGRVQIYNDGYWPICAAKHPGSMGQDFRECWFSAWPAIGDAFDRASNGETCFLVNQRMFLDRLGYLEETFFTFSFSPIRDESGAVAGLFHPVTELTQQSLAERRLGVLRDIADQSASAESVTGAVDLVADTLAASPLDVPFALLYRLDPDGRQAQLAKRIGLMTRSPLAPASVALKDGATGAWPFAESLRGGSLVVDELSERFGPFECGPYEESPRAAVVQPILLPGLTQPYGFLVTGVSSRRPLDAPYRTFHDMLGEAVCNALGKARAYEEERQRAEALAELDRAKTAFFSNVSHEFRTPLTLMLGPLETLLDGASPVAPDVREELEIVHRNGLRLLRLVNGLLDFSRLEAGRVQASYRATDLSVVTAELASNFRSACERAGLALDVECPPLPEPVYVDRDMWEKIVLNLVSNAFKFTFEGGIAVTLRAVGPAAELEVRDTGTGIPADAMPRLFERFYRVAGAQGRTYEGSGIGLALVHELVRLHGGTVQVDSEVGRGTTLIVTIPFGRSHLPAGRIDAESTLASTSTGVAPFVEEALRWLPERPADAVLPVAAPGTRLEVEEPALGAPRAEPEVRARVLVADDNADMRDYLVQLLSPRYEVAAVPDGEAALAAIRRDRPDLVLSDVMMPRMDGFELLRAIRGDGTIATTPVILLSARAGEESRVEGLDRGADDYLIKPFSARELIARVNAHVEMARIRREAERAVRESEERFRSIFEHAATGIAIAGLDGRFLQCNEAFSTMLAYTEAELGQLDIPSLIHPEDVPATMAGIRRLLEAEEPFFQLENRYVRKDGEIVWAHKFVSLLRDAGGAPSHLMALVTDITARRQAESVLRHADRMEAVGRLAGGVAHEANNQMTVVLGCAEFALARQDLPEEVATDLRQIRQAAEHTAAITAQLLAFGRQQALRPVPVDLNDAVASFAPVLRRILGETSELVLDLSPDLGPVLADRGQLEQILVNLTFNARDAMPVGGRLRLETAELSQAEPPLAPGRYGVLTVSDTGHGMDPEVLSRIFEPFFTTKPMGHGTGLGLSTVYGIVRQLGGDVRVESRPGEGASFRILLPVAVGPVLTRDLPHDHAAGAGETIMVVEDEPAVRALAARALREAGFRVLEAEHGEAALRILSAHEGRVDAVVSDVAMPVMSGRELAERLARTRPDLPVLLTSGHAPEELVRRGMLESITATLMLKPFSPDHLVERVRALIGSQPREREGLGHAAAVPGNGVAGAGRDRPSQR